MKNIFFTKVIGFLIILTLINCSEKKGIDPMDTEIISTSYQCKDILAVSFYNYYKKLSDNDHKLKSELALKKWICNQSFNKLSSNDDYESVTKILGIDFARESLFEWKDENCHTLINNKLYDSSEYDFMQIINESPDATAAMEVIDSWENCAVEQNSGVSCWLEATDLDSINLKVNYTQAYGDGSIYIIGEYLDNLEILADFPPDDRLLPVGESIYSFSKLDNQKYSRIGFNAKMDKFLNNVSCSFDIPPYCNTSTFGKLDSCEECNSNTYGEPDSCEECNPNTYGQPDSCEECNSSTYGQPDSCEECNSNTFGEADSCLACNPSSAVYGEENSCFYKLETIELHKYYSEGNTDFIYIISYDLRLLASLGYEYKGVECWVFNKPPDDIMTDEIILPLHRYLTESKNHSLLTLSDDWEWFAERGWYYDSETPLPYVLSVDNLAHSLPFQRYDGEHGNFYTISTDPNTPYELAKLGWTYRDNQGYVFPYKVEVIYKKPVFSDVNTEFEIKVIKK